MQILEAAAELISERGYTQTSVDDVIKHAGLCGKSHFYHYFKSKEELGYAVVQHRFEQFAEHGLAILRHPMIDPLERLERFIDAEVADLLVDELVLAGREPDDGLGVRPVGYRAPSWDMNFGTPTLLAKHGLADGEE